VNLERSSIRWLAAAPNVRPQFLVGVDGQVQAFYRPFLVKRGAKVRQFDRPGGALKFLQCKIKSTLLATFPFPHALHGCVRGRSPLTNARQHLDQPLVVKIDLADFYPSVTCRMVHSVWQNDFRFGPPIATLLTRLTTYKGHLPQGAPTSGYLANVVLLPAAKEIESIAFAMGCTVTFFVDDIAISGQRARESLTSIIGVIGETGFVTTTRQDRGDDARAPSDRNGLHS
jgi:RNA-directed DNA polymerase